MIALTQEKREELIGIIEKSLPVMRNEASLPYSNRELSKHVEVYELALASLTAEPKQWVIHAHGGDQFTKDADYVANAEGILGLRATPLFTAPPVPEIKLPSLELIKEVFLAKGFKEKTQPDGTVDLNPYVYDAAIALIKRLNGWGGVIWER